MSRVVLVTGGNRGIGLACALAFTEQGDRVAITCRSDPPDEVVAAGILTVPCDVTSTEQVDSAFAQIQQDLGPVEVLVANAGITRDGLVPRMADDDFGTVLDTNLTGGFRVARCAVRSMMRARWGRIVFISSITGRIGQTGQANYAASKAGQVAFTKSLSKEVASRKITVNCVSPGFIDTDFIGDLSGEQRKAYFDMVPVKRFGTPEDVAAAVLFLAGREASYITGATLEVTGGL